MSGIGFTIEFVLAVVGVAITVIAAILASWYSVRTNTSLQKIERSTASIETATDTVRETSTEAGKLVKQTDALLRGINDEMQESIHGRHRPLENIGELIAYFFATTYDLLRADVVYFVNFAVRFGEAHIHSDETANSFAHAMRKLTERPEYRSGPVFQTYSNHRDDPRGMLNAALAAARSNINSIAMNAKFHCLVLDKEKFDSGFLDRLHEEKNQHYKQYESLRDTQLRVRITNEELESRRHLKEIQGPNFRYGEVEKIPMQFICGRLKHDGDYEDIQYEGREERDRWITTAFFVGSHSLYTDDSDGVVERPSKAIGVFTRTSRYALVCTHIYGWLKGQSEAPAMFPSPNPGASLSPSNLDVA